MPCLLWHWVYRHQLIVLWWDHECLSLALPPFLTSYNLQLHGQDQWSWNCAWMQEEQMVEPPWLQRSSEVWIGNGDGQSVQECHASCPLWADEQDSNKVVSEGETIKYHICQYSFMVFLTGCIPPLFCMFVKRVIISLFPIDVIDIAEGWYMIALADSAKVMTAKMHQSRNMTCSREVCNNICEGTMCWLTQRIKYSVRKSSTSMPGWLELVHQGFDV